MSSYALTQRHLFTSTQRIFSLLNLLPVFELIRPGWKVHAGQLRVMSLTSVILPSDRNSSFDSSPSLLVNPRAPAPLADTRMHRFLTTGSITDWSPKLFLAHCLSTETVLSRWLSATGTLSRSIPCGYRTLLMPNFGSAVLPKPGLAAFLRRLCSLGRTLNPGLLPSYLCFVQLPPWQLFLSPCSLHVTPLVFLLIKSWLS